MSEWLHVYNESGNVDFKNFDSKYEYKFGEPQATKECTVQELMSYGVKGVYRRLKHE